MSPYKPLETDHTPGEDRPAIGNSNRWEFYQDGRKRWFWKKYLSDLVVAASPDGFPSFQECIGNAEKTGYVAPLHGKPRSVAPR